MSRGPDEVKGDIDQSQKRLDRATEMAAALIAEKINAVLATDSTGMDIGELEALKLRVGQAYLPGITDEQTVELGEMEQKIDAQIAKLQELQTKIETPEPAPAPEGTPEPKLPSLTQAQTDALLGKTPAETPVRVATWTSEPVVPPEDKKYAPPAQPETSVPVGIDALLGKPFGTTMLQNMSFAELLPVYGNLESVRNETNRKEVDKWLEEVNKWMDHREVTENRRLSREDNSRLEKEFAAASLPWADFYLYTPAQLLMALEIMERWENRFPGNMQVESDLRQIREYIKEKEKSGTSVPGTTSDEQKRIRDAAMAEARARKGTGVVGAIPPTPKSGGPEKAKGVVSLDPKWTTPEEMAVQTKLEEARTKYARAYNEFLADRKKKTGKITRAIRFIKGQKVEDSEVPPELKKLEEEYDQMAVQYGNQMYATEKARLEKSGKTALEQDEELKRYKQDKIFTRIIVQEQAFLSGLKVGNLPPKERNIAFKLLDAYLKIQPPWKRWALSSVLAGGLFVFTAGTATVAGGVGLVGVMGNRFVRAGIGSQVAQTAARSAGQGYDWLFRKSTAKIKGQEKNLSEAFAVESFDTSLAKSKKEHASIVAREQAAKRNKLVTKALAGLAVGGVAAWGMGQFSFGDGDSIDAPQGVTREDWENSVGRDAPEAVSKYAWEKNTNPFFRSSPEDMLPDPSDHSAQAEEMRRIAASLGIHEKIEDPIAKALEEGAQIPEQSPDIPEPAQGQAPELTEEGQIHTAMEERQATERAAQVAAETAAIPGAGHEIINNFSVKLGENGVPKNLETVFNEISADRMNLPGGGKIGEEFATKSLNMAANMVKLSEGHGVAGIDADEFAKAVSFQNGVLQIKDHGVFNGILEKLQGHSDELWNKGTLQGQGAAVTYISKISQDSWLKIMHADGLHETVDSSGVHTPTGILGHQEITAEDITKFDDSEMVKHAMEAGKRATEVAEAKARVLEQMATTKDVLDVEPVKGAEQTIYQQQNFPPHTTAYDNLINRTLPRPGDRTGYERLIDRHAPPVYEHVPTPEEILGHLNTVYESNLDMLYENYPGLAKDPEAFHRMLGHTLQHPAQDTFEDMADPKIGDDPLYGPLVEYFQQIQKVLGEDFKPRGVSLTNLKPETTEEFLRRSLGEAARRGPDYLNQLTLSK